MQRLATIVLVVAVLCWLGSAPARAQAPPIGLYGTWTSTVHPGAGGQIQLLDLQVANDGSMVGRSFFTGSPCAVWANFSGRSYGNTAQFSMIVGPCGMTTVMLQWQGAAWVGSYTSQFPDAGIIQMVP